jgi:hypothetical protein
MTKRTILTALTLTLITLASSDVFAGTRVGNGSTMSVSPDMPLQCTFHHTKACDDALAALAKDKTLMHPLGEGLPLPWPFPWWLPPHAAKS